MNNYSEEARLRFGARRMLPESMELRSGDTVVIFSDETTAAPARALIDAAVSLNLRVREQHVSLEHQRRFDPARGLCRECRESFQNVTAILTCLSDSPETTVY